MLFCSQKRYSVRLTTDNADVINEEAFAIGEGEDDSDEGNSASGASSDDFHSSGMIRSLSSSSLFSQQSSTNSPRYRLKVDELDDFLSQRKFFTFTTTEKNPVILEEVEKENDHLNELLEKVRNTIEKQETFLKKIAMQNDDVEGDEIIPIHTGCFEEIKESENDEKCSSSSDEGEDGNHKRNFQSTEPIFE